MRMDWSTRRVVDFIDVTLMSAGTLSPTNGKAQQQQLTMVSFLQVFSLNIAHVTVIHPADNSFKEDGREQPKTRAKCVRTKCCSNASHTAHVKLSHKRQPAHSSTTGKVR